MKQETILCLLLEKDSPEQDNNEDVFIAFIDKNHAEIRLNHPTTGANLDNIEEDELFRITINTKPGSLHIITSKATISDWIWINNTETIEQLKQLQKYSQDFKSISKFIKEIPQMAQQLRNSKIENILEKTNDDK